MTISTVLVTSQCSMTDCVHLGLRRLTGWLFRDDPHKHEPLRTVSSLGPALHSAYDQQDRDMVKEAEMLSMRCACMHARSHACTPACMAFFPHASTLRLSLLSDNRR